MVVADFPFGSYESSPEQALITGVRFFKEAKVGAVKLEGGRKILPQIQRLIAAGMPVMGHLGLTPQSVHTLGGFKVQGRGEDGERIFDDARALAAAGVFAIVLEAVPAQLASEISKELTIPVIGIGAGADVDGQVLVVNDLLGLTKGFKPRFLRQYLNLFEEINGAVKSYIKDVKTLDFPNEKEQY
jgi:3-methyl-2-oxobutanoate hydroxymethyltransferase